MDLDRQQGFSLLAEIISTRNLLAYGIRVIRSGTFIDATRDPILTMLSIGVEKLYNLTLGLASLDRDRRWPTKAEMQKLGHKLVPMHQAVMDELRTRTANESQSVRGLLAEVDNDPVVVPLIEALDTYGRMGRFYYLDQLGDAPQPVRPDDAWQDIEKAALADPAVATLHEHAKKRVGDNEAWDELIRALHERIAVAVERVWIVVAVCADKTTH